MPGSKICAAKKSLSTPSPTYDYMLKALETVGIRKEDVTLGQFGTAGQLERAAETSRGDDLTAPNTYSAEKQGLRRFSIIRDLAIRQLITVTGTTKRFLREKRDTAEAFLRGYVERLAYIKTHKDVTMKVIGRLYPPGRY